MVQRYLLLSLLLLFPLSGNAQTGITVEDAVRIALENNYQLKQAQNNIDLADMEVMSAYGDFLPSINGSFNGNQRVGQQFDPSSFTFGDLTIYSMSGGLSSSVPLFNGFRNINNLRRSETQRSFQGEQLERLRQNVIFTTASRFLQVVLNDELLTISRRNLSLSMQQLERIEAQVEVGARPMVDLLNQASVVANDELAVVQRENALTTSMAQLMRVMQDDSGTDYTLIMPDTDGLNLTPVNMDLNDLVRMALQSRSDLRAQMLAIERAEYDRAIVRATLLPSLNASFGINGSYSDQYRDPVTREPLGFSDQFFDRNVNRFLGFNVQIPLFNNLNRRTNYQQAQIAVKNSRLELENVRFQINEEVRQAYNDYISIVQELESTEKALAAAERAYETELQRYEVGASTLIELNQANANFVQAQSGRIQAVYNFVFQEKVLDFFLGRLTDQIEL
ncbi:MAG: TolC family protein [Balneolaceae bacterium]|nr:MAG: TolC family protein [Balneolaceae bacterium]